LSVELFELKWSVGATSSEGFIVRRLFATENYLRLLKAGYTLHTGREYGPYIRAVNTGSVYRVIRFV